MLLFVYALEALVNWTMTYPPSSLQTSTDSVVNVSHMPGAPEHMNWITRIMMNNQIQCSDCLEVVRRPSEVLYWDNFKCKKCEVLNIPNWLHPMNIAQNRGNNENNLVDNQDNQDESNEEPPRIQRQIGARW